MSLSGTKKEEISTTKLKILDMLIANPEISYVDIGKALAIDQRTAKKYKKELEELIIKIKGQVEAKIEEKIQKEEGLWQKIMALVS